MGENSSVGLYGNGSTAGLDIASNLCKRFGEHRKKSSL
jgi:hypothetical protein